MSDQARNHARALFEKQWGFTDEEQGLHFIPEIDSYGCALFSNSEICDRKNSAWYYFMLGWEKSRAELVVTLPELREDSDATDAAGAGLLIPQFDQGFDEAVNECRSAVEAAGLKVRQ